MPCTICKTWWGQSAAPGQCEQVTCMLCGTRQCKGNGLSRGTCGTCHYGMLPGWYGNDDSLPCKYKGCTGRIVSRYAPRKGRVCREHFIRIMGAESEYGRMAKVT